MSPSSAPLEGVVVLVIDEPHAASRIERLLASRGAAVFVAHDDDGCLKHLENIVPHFAVVDPSVTVDGPTGAAWRLFSHLECRTIVYSADVHGPAGMETRWLIEKTRPVSDVVEAILTAVSDPVWIAKGGDDVKPVR